MSKYFDDRLRKYTELAVLIKFKKGKPYWKDSGDLVGTLKSGQRSILYKGSSISAKRLLFFKTTGAIVPESTLIKYKDGDKDNNRMKNYYYKKINIT